MATTTMKPHYEGFDEDGQPIGKHPDTLAVSDLDALGHHKAPLLKVIRENCLECAGSRSEVRRCAVFTCRFWPYRMATNPFHGSRGRSAETWAVEVTEDAPGARH